MTRFWCGFGTSAASRSMSARFAIEPLCVVDVDDVDDERPSIADARQRVGLARRSRYMLISIAPYLSVSRAVQFLKGKSSHKLLSEFARLRKRYWGQHLWARGYWVATSGNVTDEVWKKYIESQQLEPPDDNFKVV